MSEFKGNKGDWTNINVQLSDWSTCCVGIDKGAVICNMYYEGIEITEEAKANAVLISHAPQMLELLKRMYDTYSVNERVSGSLRDFMIEAKQLIQQATTI